MSMIKIDRYLSFIPKLDLHGENSEMAIYLVKDFIKDNIKLKNKKIIIIHGKGKGILKNAIHEYLKNDKRVLKYSLDNFNDGLTIVILDI